MPSRPCDFCFGLQDDSVFMDLNLDQDNRFYLVRISFDGFGCCHIYDTKRKLDLVRSNELIRRIKSDDFNHPSVSKIISFYLNENKDVLWEDALVEHQLIS
jgi:hypothetical protein